MPWPPNEKSHRIRCRGLTVLLFSYEGLGVALRASRAKCKQTTINKKSKLAT